MLIEMRGIERTYVMGDNLVHALRGVDLKIDKGDSIAIMGTSGSGKSTMMNILGCLDQPTKGTYFLNGKDVSRLSRAQLADVRGRMIGFVFQSFNLLSRTSALENVEMPLMYQGVPSRERHRRALVGNAPIIMADEPTGNLDTKTSHEVMSILQSLNDQGITIVLVTHEMDIAAHARRVITLRDGMIVDDKTQDPVRAAA